MLLLFIQVFDWLNMACFRLQTASEKREARLKPLPDVAALEAFLQKPGDNKRELTSVCWPNVSIQNKWPRLIVDIQINIIYTSFSLMTPCTASSKYHKNNEVVGFHHLDISISHERGRLVGLDRVRHQFGHLSHGRGPSAIMDGCSQGGAQRSRLPE